MNSFFFLKYPSKFGFKEEVFFEAGLSCEWGIERDGGLGLGDY